MVSDGLAQGSTASGGRRVALVGDLHTYRLAVGPWRLFGKRLVGQGNVWFSRRRRFERALLPVTFERVVALSPDVVLMSGDLTSTALPREFADMVKLLSPMCEQVRTYIVPGNHDRYTYSSGWRRAFEKRLTGLVFPDLPRLESLGGGWDVLLLDTAVPRLLDSRGQIGEKQLRKAGDLLEGGDRGRGLVVLTHYPVVTPASFNWRWKHRLAGRRALIELLAKTGRRVVFMHGHIHQPWLFQPEGAGLERLTDLNAGSPAQINLSYPHGQGFWEVALPDDAVGRVIYRHHVLVSREPVEWEMREHADPWEAEG